MMILNNTGDSCIYLIQLKNLWGVVMSFVRTNILIVYSINLELFTCTLILFSETDNDVNCHRRISLYILQEKYVYKFLKIVSI